MVLVWFPPEKFTWSPVGIFIGRKLTNMKVGWPLLAW